ncbi:plasmid transfer protein TraB [Streptomyces sp. NPDC047987]|uniref:plasmid transfer protein TraB n=2 Tax=unclassified Streptomyces TaxID=2593676 RepID=UPI003442FE73
MNRTTDQHTTRRGSSGVGTYLLHRAMPHLPPWLGVAGVGIVGSGAHLLWSDSVGAGVGLTLSAVALTGATWWAGRETSTQRRLHSAITVAAGSAWMTGAALAGPLTGILPDTFLMGGAVLALSWNIRMALRTSDGAAPAESADKGLLAKVGLAKAKIGRTEVEPNRVTAALALEGGEQTNDDVARALVRIASALDLPQSAVRYQPSADSARRGELVIVPKDMLNETVEWAGPSNPGGSITDPLVIGQYDDGSPLMVWLPGDPDVGRNASHFLIAGGTGSGKGDAALNLMTEILSRGDVIMWLSDPKAFQDFRPLLPAYDWAVEGGADTEAMVEALQHVIPARTGWLGKHSYRQWTPQAAQKQTDPAHSCAASGACGCPGMPYMVAWMEEAANTLRNLGDDAFTGIAQEARSAGVSLIVSLQRPSYDQMSTSTRASLPSVIALGCDPRDEGFSLPESVINQGAHPGAWGNRRPGYCYVVSGGIDPERYASPGRTQQFTTRAVSLMETLAEWAVRNGATADPITAGAAKAVVGRAYTGRADTDETEPTTVHDQDDEITTGTQLDPEDAAMDPEQDLPPAQQGDDTPGLFGTDTGRKPSPEEARELFARALDEFEAAGQMIVGPKDFMDWCDANGYSRPWVSARLRDAAAEGRLQPTNQTGRWRIVPALTPA